MKMALPPAALARMLAARAVMARDAIFDGYQDFGGTCRSFGPGDYAALPWGIDNAVSSGRRISSENPYNGAPNWRH